MGQFRVIDLRSGLVEPEHLVDACTPEEAAAKALGESVVRGGINRKRIVCRVYWSEAEGQMNMVRLYRAPEV